MANDIQSFASNADNLTKSIGSIQGSIKSLTKDLMNYKRIQDEVFNKKMEVKCDLSGVRKEFATFFKEVNQGFQESQKSGKAQQKVINEMTQSCKNFAKAAKEAGTAEKALNDFSEKGTVSSNSKNNEKSSLQKALTEKDLLKQLGTSAANLAGGYATSIYGDRGGSAISSIVGGIGIGAATGFSVGGPVGSIVGTITGLLSGICDVIAKELKSKDDFIKNEVKAAIDSEKKSQSESLSNGISISDKSEVNELNLSYLLKSKDNAKKFINEITEFSSNSNLKVEDALGIGKKLIVSGYKQNEVEPFLATLGDTSAALGINSQDTKGIANILINAKTKNKISDSDLEYMDNFGMNATDAVAKDLNVSKDGVKNKVKSGEIKGEQVAEILTRHMINNFGGWMKEYLNTSEGLKKSRDEKREIRDKQKGDGYNKIAKDGYKKEIDYFNSEEGKREGIAYSKIGEDYGRIQNKKIEREIEGKQQIFKVSLIPEGSNIFGLAPKIDKNSKSGKWDIFDEAAKRDEDYQGLYIESRLASKKSQTDTEFKNSKENKKLQEYEKLLIENIQGNIGANSAYINQAKINADQLTVGPGACEIIAENQGKKEKSFHFGSLIGKLPEKAIGLDRVPYDNYPAILHEGERVLTRVEADQQQSSGVTPVINMYNTVRDDSDIDKIVTALVTQLSKVQGSFGGAY